MMKTAKLKGFPNGINSYEFVTKDKTSSYRTSAVDGEGWSLSGLLT